LLHTQQDLNIVEGGNEKSDQYFDRFFPCYAPDRSLARIRILQETVEMFLDLLYAGGTKIERLQKRNDEIRKLFSEGMTKTEIARRFDISVRRVGQIIDNRSV
jgi:DNA-binding NarL/FixJ family response regulator